MIKTVSLLAILTITISLMVGLQYADAQHPGNITIPLGPDNLSITAISSGTATLSWNAPDESDVSERDKVDEYLVDVFVGDKIYTNNDDIHIQKSITVDRNPPSAPQSTVRIENLDNDKDYTFVVRSVAVAEALDSHGVPLTRDARAFVEFVPGLFEKYYAATTLERAAQDLTVDVDETKATVKWTAPNNPSVTDKSKFRLNITNDEDKHNGNFTIEDPTGNQYSVDVTGLLAGTTYKFEVNTIQGLGPSNNVQVSVTTRLADSQVETIKENPRLENPSLNNLRKVSTDDSITLSWSNKISTSNTNRCSVEVSQNGEHVRHTYLAGVGTTSYTIGNLEPNTEYTFVISCYDDRVDRPLVLTRTTATTQGPGVPDTPIDLQLTKYGNDVNLFWQRADGNGSPIIDYIVEYSSDDGNTWSTYNDGISSSTSVVVTGLADGKYIFRVSAENSVGQGAPQVSFYYVSATIDNQQTSDNKPNTVTNLRAEVSDGTVTLTWNEPPTKTNTPQVTGYTVYRNNGNLCNPDPNNRQAYDPNLWCLRTGTPITDTVYSTSIGNGVTHTFRVHAVNSNGDSEPSFVTVTTEKPNTESKTEERSPVPEIPGAVSPESDDDIETEIGGKTVTLKLFAFNDANGDGEKQSDEGDSPVSLTVVIYQPSTGEIELMDRVSGEETIKLLPEPFYVIPMKVIGYEFTTPIYIDEQGVEEKGVVKVNETYRNGITFEELFVNNSGLELELEAGAIITVGIGVVPS